MADRPPSVPEIVIDGVEGAPVATEQPPPGPRAARPIDEIPTMPQAAVPHRPDPEDGDEAEGPPLPPLQPPRTPEAAEAAVDIPPELLEALAEEWATSLSKNFDAAAEGLLGIATDMPLPVRRHILLRARGQVPPAHSRELETLARELGVDLQALNREPSGRTPSPLSPTPVDDTALDALRPAELDLLVEEWSDSLVTNFDTAAGHLREAQDMPLRLRRLILQRAGQYIDDEWLPDLLALGRSLGIPDLKFLPTASSVGTSGPHPGEVAPAPLSPRTNDPTADPPASQGSALPV